MSVICLVFTLICFVNSCSLDRVELDPVQRRPPAPLTICDSCCIARESGPHVLLSASIAPAYLFAPLRHQCPAALTTARMVEEKIGCAAACG